MLEEIKTPQELNDFIINNITYGFISQNKEKFVRERNFNDLEYEKELFSNYYLQTPEELLESKCGICFDQVELARKWLLDNGYEVFTFYTIIRNHVFIVYKNLDNYYLFETSIKYWNGIHKFNSLNECLNEYIKLQKSMINNKYNFELYYYDNVLFGSNTGQLFDYFKQEKRKIRL